MYDGRPPTRREWRRLRRPVHEDLYRDLVGTIGCGAFDGGCVIVAQALQRVVGGEVHVAVREDDVADHAATMVAGRLWDWDGPAVPGRFIREFNRVERARTTGWRPIRDGDLPGAPRDDALVARLAILLARALDGAIPTVHGG